MKKFKKIVFVIVLISFGLGIYDGYLIKKGGDPRFTLMLHNNDHVTHVGALYYYQSDTGDSPFYPFGSNYNIKVGLWFLPGIKFAN